MSDDGEMVVELVADPATADRHMVRVLCQFVAQNAPVMMEDGTWDPHGMSMAPLVREARDLAIVAAFRRIERIAEAGEHSFDLPFPEGDDPCPISSRRKRKRPPATLTRPTGRSGGPPETPG